MEIDLTDKNLNFSDKIEIEKLLTRENKNINSDLEQMWYLMNLIWSDYDCNNKNLEWDKISQFYSHPVWLLNGLFIEQHAISMGHRHSISDWIINHNFRNVVDYGGGFGTLARLIAEKGQEINVDVYEPHPSDFGLKRAKDFQNIKIVEQLGSQYDCLVSTDVLEHVPDPLGNFIDMAKSVKLGGYLIIANCFLPVIECHLPQTFHLKYTFNLFARLIGLEAVGRISGSHATIYKKVDITEVNQLKLRFIEKLSKAIFPLMEVSKKLLERIKKQFVK